MGLLDSVRGFVAQGAPQRIGALMRRYERTGDPAVLRAALVSARNAVRMVPAGHPDLAMHLTNFGSVLNTVAERTGSEERLRQAIEVQRRAIAVAPAGFDLAMTLSNVSGALTRLFELTGDIAALEEAAQIGREAITAAGDDDADLAMYLSNLASTLVTLVRQNDDLDALDEAVRCGSLAVEVARSDDPRLFMYLSNLALAWRARAERTGDGEALTQAVATSRAAVAQSQRSPLRHAGQAGCLSGLASALIRTYDATGDIAMLEEAVQAGRDAVTASQPGQPGRPTLLSNLGISLARLFERTGDAAAIGEAVAVGRQAVSECAPGHSGLAMYQANLASFLTRYYERTRDLAALDEAIEAGRGAADLLPAGHPDTAKYLSNLGNALRARFEDHGRPQDREDALAASRAAARAAERSASQDRAVVLSDLALSLLVAAQAGLGDQLLGEAVGIARDAVQASAADHPDAARCQLVLGWCLLSQAETTPGNPRAAAVAEARDVLAQAAATTAAPISIRIDAGRRLARAAMRTGDVHAALTAIEDAIDLLPLLASRMLGRKDREWQLGEVFGIGAQGAAIALAAGQPALAVSLLEQARGVLLTESLGIGEQQAKLAAHAPDLEAEFVRLRDLLAEPEVASDRRTAFESWQELLATIRDRPALADFLAGPSPSELRQAAAGGTVVVISTDSDRCDAIIITGSDDRFLRHVPLPGLSQEAVFDQVDRLQVANRALGGAGLAALTAAEAGIGQVLSWLWDTAAEPVLSALGYDGPPQDGHWPHVWWCPVGAMAYLPLHAAGRDGQMVLDRVVSSYAVTVRALGQVMRRPKAGSPLAPLIVAMPRTPGQPDLPGVLAEATALRELMPAATVLEGEQATSAAVLGALPGHGVAHFACHGRSDPDDPGASALLLSDAADHPLTVTEISRQNLTGAELAYLSACSTTDTKPALADEAVHITAAVQLAGYRNVIGTLWPVDDRSARRVAEAVYRELTGQGADLVDPDAAAGALHHAVRGLRDRAPDLPSRWAGYVHYGGAGRGGGHLASSDLT